MTVNEINFVDLFVQTKNWNRIHSHRVYLFGHHLFHFPHPKKTRPYNVVSTPKNRFSEFSSITPLGL